MQDRYIVVRETDGRLRQARWEERDRMNQIYFPKEGRHLTLPQMLTSSHLPHVLQGGASHRHEEVLDLCNLQCEPDSPDYIRVGHCSSYIRALMYHDYHRQMHKEPLMPKHTILK